MKVLTFNYLALLLASAPLTAIAGNKDVKDGKWEFKYDKETSTLAYRQNGKTLLQGATARAVDANRDTIYAKDYPEVSLSSVRIKDAFGEGRRHTYRYHGLDGKSELHHNIYVYPSLPYILTDAVIVSETPTSSTNISPITTSAPTSLITGKGDIRIYDMPFANDNWATFNSRKWEPGKSVTSCEATAIYNVDTRKAVVIGSVDHSVWKAGITVIPGDNNTIAGLTAEAGYISDRTWDTFTDGRASSKEHGEVRGKKIASPRFMVGAFEDWRDGLETFGVANTVLCPKYEWDKDESLFGWQSWGGMEWGLNYESAMSVLDYFEKELKPAGFHNEKGRCHIVLDSGWNALSDDELRKFADKCKALGFAAGIYATPFSYWGGEDAIRNNELWEGGRLGEMVLKADGKPRKINGWSLDPTHPAVKESNRRTFEKFRKLGFEFVKIDFMNNGTQEADQWYDPNVTTGLQAYNIGMDYVTEFAGDMMLDYSIAPIFPAKAHVRRIGCDAWGDLPQSMYTLNCINGSWWLDKVYAFNDPDHMCLSKVPFSGKGSNDENESRIRYTCGLMTGMTLLGGTYAYEGPTKDMYGKPFKVVGYDEERALATNYASNKDLTAMGRIGKTFRPVDGKFDNFSTLYNHNDISVDSEFYLDTPESLYYVVFNYDTASGAKNIEIPYSRLGVKAGEFAGVKELWTGETFSPSETSLTIPAKDVRIFRLDRK